MSFCNPSVAIVCWMLLLLSSCCAFTLPKVDFNPTIEDLVVGTNKEKELILQAALDRSTDRLVTLFVSVADMIRTQVGRTHIAILNNRVREQTREYTNDIWIIVDNANKALDALTTNAKRRIEALFGNDSRWMGRVEAAMKEMSLISWQWQNNVGRLLYDSNERHQALVLGLASEALKALRQSGWNAVEQVLINRRAAFLRIVYDVRDRYIAAKNIGDKRIQVLSQILLDTWHQAQQC